MSLKANPKQFLKSVSNAPGVYQMLDASGNVIYVGKAKKLKNRLSSYFREKLDSPKTQVLMQHVESISVTLTASETEALLLEHNLIKKLKPRYNICLRDDKSYPFIYVSSHAYPSLTSYRGKKARSGKTFGPYPNGLAVKNTLHLLQKLFKLRSCSDTFFNNRSRPCLQYQIKRCSAPCVGHISEENYGLDIGLAELFLKGKSHEVLTRLVTQMEAASDAKDYERAAYFRDLIANVKAIQSEQMISQGQSNIDVLAVSEAQGYYCIQALLIRDGSILGSKSYFPKVPAGSELKEVLASFIEQYYLNQVRAESLPKIIIANIAIEDPTWLCNAIAEQAQHTLQIKTAIRGQRKQWVDMALRTADQALKVKYSEQTSQEKRNQALLNLLGMKREQFRIECFDISHSSGEATVASCVVFDEGGANKSLYRRYNIKNITPGDDYAAMHQVLLKRYQKVKTHQGQMPDILLIDGGKGQLHQAEQVLEQLQINDILIIGVAKGPGRKAGLETLWQSGRAQPIKPAQHDIAFHLIQHIRDEAHRFAITGHRQQRDKKRSSSLLEDIPGVGAKRRQALLKYFGGLQQLSSASIADISKVPGISTALATILYESLHLHD